MDTPPHNQNEAQPTAHQGSPVLTTSLVVTVLAITTLSAFWYYLSTLSEPQYSDDPEHTVFAVLSSGNQDFAEADRLFRLKRYAEATEKFKASLSLAKDSYQEGQIKFKIALSTSLENNGKNYLAAIPLFKEVADNALYTDVVRANAVEEMGLKFAAYGDTAITTAIFSTKPYSGMFDPNQIAVSYRKLYEYATSLHPLAISELRVAFWHANHALKTAKALAKANAIPLSSVLQRAGEIELWEKLAAEKNQNATELQTSFSKSVNIVYERLQRAERDIERIRDNPNENGAMPMILQRKAVIAMRMRALGDTSFEDPGPLLLQVLNIYAARGSSSEDGYARYYYAQYLLENKDTVDSAALSKILAPLYTPEYANTSVQDFLRNERSNTLGVKSQVRAIARVDSDFRNHLRSLGWQEKDL